MKVRGHQTFAWLAALILMSSSAFHLALADGNRASGGPGEQEVKSVAEHGGRLEAGKRVSAVAIEQVKVSRINQQTQVRVEGSGELSCISFHLNDPLRLILDCSNAHVGLQQKVISSGLPPVRRVRVVQFKEDVARLVVELERKATYSMQTDAHVVTLVFDTAPGLRPGSQPKLENESDNHPNSDPATAAERSSPSPDADLQRLQSQQLPASRAPISPGPLTVGAEQPAVALPEAPKVTPRSTEPPASVKGLAPRGEQKPELSRISPNGDYVIGPQDVLAINVWREPEISRALPVRPDGKISLPLVGDITASGLTPSELQGQIAKGLEAYIHKPQVTVIVQEANSHKFYIIGEVERPGVYALTTNLTVLDALAAAGGFREFAKVKDIYLLRRTSDGSRKSIPFNFKAAVDGRKPYRDLELQPGDTIVVP